MPILTRPTNLPVIMDEFLAAAEFYPFRSRFGIERGQVVYQREDGQLALASAAEDGPAARPIGLACGPSNTSVFEILKRGFSYGYDAGSLQPGQVLYLGDEPGTVQSEPGTVHVRIGRTMAVAGANRRQANWFEFQWV